MLNEFNVYLIGIGKSENGLVGVKCKVELDDGRVVNIFASEDDDVVCVRRSDIQKAINDLDEAAK